ncbi:MAG: hypothetical protein A2Y25_11950 [Candidatus Melainabacteria bacterium GWF2_37_15]|nr:MAG: hypothetical protein A2Y25_11950 [Candidatus Melainabacteria bacterium GWF2_37_15]
MITSFTRTVTPYFGVIIDGEAQGAINEQKKTLQKNPWALEKLEQRENDIRNYRAGDKNEPKLGITRHYHDKALTKFCLKGPDYEHYVTFENKDGKLTVPTGKEVVRKDEKAPRKKVTASKGSTHVDRSSVKDNNGESCYSYSSGRPISSLFIPKSGK